MKVQLSAEVKINELLYDPSGSDGGKEWIELYNNSKTPVDLTGWKIYTAGSEFSLAYTFPECEIAAKSFLVVGAPDFCDLSFGFSFQNGGSATDGVKLVDSSGVCQDVLLYDAPNTNGLQVEKGLAGDKFAPDVSGGHSLARNADGQDSDDCQEDFRDCGKPTPGESNVEIILPLKISEIYYNPLGADGDQEWIEIYNPTDTVADLTGWQILSAGNSFSTEYTFGSCQMGAKSFLLIGASDFCDLQESVSFQNGGGATDGVKLVSPDYTYCDVVLYDSENVNLLTDESGAVATSYAPNVKEGQSLARVDLEQDLNLSGEDFLATDFLTPGSENKFPLALKLANFQKIGTKLSTQIFNLSTFDLQSDLAKISLSYAGEIIDEHTVDFLPAGGSQEVFFELENQEQFYQVWRVNLECEFDADNSDNSLALSQVSSLGVVTINEVMPSPADGGAEWLELYNTSDEKIEIKGLQIRDKSGDVSSFDLEISAEGYLVLTADFSEFSGTYPLIDSQKVVELKNLVSLNNNDEVLILQDSLGTVLDSVSYGKVNTPKGVSLEKFGYGDLAYFWGECLETATPGEANSVKVYKYKEFFDVCLSHSVCTQEEPIKVSYSVPELRSTVRVHCRVFDMYGNLKRTLSNYGRSATSGELEFDGKDDSGDRLESCVYLLKLCISRGNNLYQKQWDITVK